MTKLQKILSISLTAGGLGLVIPFGTLLGLGANKTVDIVEFNPLVNKEAKETIGVGSVNYGKMWVDNKFISNSAAKISFNEWYDATISAGNAASLALSSDASLNPVTKQQMEFLVKTRDAAQQGRDMMISGAVFTSIFIATGLTGLGLLIFWLIKYKW